jgi:DMSO/TMAO reductase YedYZ molybdopterin-dependent catalytic subunit
MPQTTEYGALYCVADPERAIMQGNWTGVQLSYLLQQANVSQNAVKVGLFVPDSFSTDFPAPWALQDNTTVLAYAVNNTALGQLQLVVLGDWGYNWITNPTQIQLFSYDFLGEYETQGYPDDGYSTPLITNQLLTQTPLPTNTPAQNGVIHNNTNSPAPTSAPQLPKLAPTPTNTNGTSNQKAISTFSFLI